ncbi:recombinase family protein [Sphingomonas ginsenosidivorax]|uniref:Recombinase family protein n=1 Tax=Sphingomonas ginsenosidivorax TaxID=862135 RepID=A0A5C6UEV2_9SPHN|nr:recombinase family protein [Sphingomonas ginsenosidivorax]TXC71229.1 recombinase family protein [Sphingomonas ginsenosidivorax]
MFELAEPASPAQVRCAIYTRKSSDVGLERDVNSLDAQREICAAYVKCNEHKGWRELPTRYDDGGYSGGTLDRPALHRLFADVESGEIDAIVFYKIDRLTRSLADFVRLMESMERFGISFVSVTQSFDTSDSMGRMVLNVLITFAQFEREMLSDRIKDKLAVMRRNGLFVSGKPPLGYDKISGRLVVNETEAQIVRGIFSRVGDYPTVFQLMKQLESEGVRTKAFTSKSGRTIGGTPMHAGSIYRLLRNPLYIGFIKEGDEWHRGQHKPIVDREIWDRAQALRAIRSRPRIAWDVSRNLLHGLIWDEFGRPLHTNTGGTGKQRYRYYDSEPKDPRRQKQLSKVRVRADVVEELTFASLSAFFADVTEIRRAMLKLSRFETVDEQLAVQASTVAERLAQSSRDQIRHLYEMIFVRVEVAKAELRLIIKCNRLALLLATGKFNIDRVVMEENSPPQAHLISINANLICAHRDFSLPIKPTQQYGIPDKKLVNLLGRAFEARAFVMANRDKPIADLAKTFKLGPSKFSRLIRLTYLAPDLQAAIIDGNCPNDLTPHKLIYSALPLDWQQQRLMLGFDMLG